MSTETTEVCDPPLNAVPLAVDTPDLEKLPWREYRKTAATKMVRMSRPFRVLTPEGLMLCEDGWLALDSQGRPYPIADSVQRETYERI